MTTTPAELDTVHQEFINTYNMTAHQGLLKASFVPPIPLVVLGTAHGRQYPPAELLRTFTQALVRRTTNRYGCVTLHHYHFYVEAGLPKCAVLLWVDGAQVRAVVDNVVLAEYQCRYDWRTHQVTAICDGVFYPTRFASPQGSVFPFNPQESLVLYRPPMRSWPRLAALGHEQLRLL